MGKAVHEASLFLVNCFKIRICGRNCPSELQHTIAVTLTPPSRGVRTCTFLVPFVATIFPDLFMSLTLDSPKLKML
jgi:hypothetical protein